MPEKDNNVPNTQKSVEMPEVQNELSKVAANPKQSMLILIVVCLILGYVFYIFFIQDNKGQEKPQPIAIPTDVVKPVDMQTSNVPSIPKLPDIPKIQPPVIQAPPPLPLPVPVKQELPPPLPKIDIPDKITPALPSMPKDLQPKLNSRDGGQRRETKIKSSMILIAGTEPKQTPEQLQQAADFQDRGDMTLVLGKGKIIDAILETAINSDLTTEIRAVVGRDVFSEQGKTILIPKGSRIFGNYSSDNSNGRVGVTWTRVDLSSGYTINFDGNAVDNLGRKGVQGRLDNKFTERFANAVLISAFTIAVAKGLDKIVPPVVNSQTSAANQALATQIQNLALATSNTAGLDEGVKIAQICANVQNAILDKTSMAYTSIVQACSTIPVTTGAQPGQRLNLLMTAVNAAAASLITNVVNTTPTQVQQASTQSFKDVTNVVKEMITGQRLGPTTTIDQGTLIKIYVTKDYKFPKSIFQKSKLLH